MPAEYSNFRAFRALTKASLTAITKSPSAIVFGLLFPLIFILVFGFLGGGGGYKVAASFAADTDTSGAFAQGLKKIDAIKWNHYADTGKLGQAFREGDITLVSIHENAAGAVPHYSITLRGASSQADKMQQLRSIIQQAFVQRDPVITERLAAAAAVNVEEIQIREYKNIDFILPGQLGFSLLAGSIFGTAFVFYNLRQLLVLKRFFATPVRRGTIVLSEGVARMIFQLATAVIILLIGHYGFGFTLIHGLGTALEMLGICVMGIMVFMGFGFIISSVAKNESVIPAFSNLITLPQFLLAGTFFPTSAFPKWLKPIADHLPLTYFNDAMRKIAFNGASFGEIWQDLLGLTVWGVIVYIIAGRVFKWE